MTSGFSSTVARFFRAFHRHSLDANPAHDDNGLIAASHRAPPTHTRLPSTFTRHVRHLVETVVKLRAAPTASVRRHTAAAKALDRITQQLQARDDNDARAVPLNVALEQLLTVWECVLQCLDLSRAVTTAGATLSATDRLSTCSSSSSSSASDDSMRLETAGRRLLTLLVQQREFDAALMALGRGECNAHQNDGTRKRSTHDGSRPDELLVSMRLSRRNSVLFKQRPPRPVPSKRDVSKTSDAPLCVLTKKYLDLHQTTLRLLQDAFTAAGDRLDDANDRDNKLSDRALLMQFLAVSYVRVPTLRTTMLESFQEFVESSDGRRRRVLNLEQQQNKKRTTSMARKASFMRGRSVTVVDSVNIALFRWTQTLSSKCHSSITPYNRDGYWVRESRRMELAMEDPKFQRVLLAQLIDHFLAASGAGGIDWKCLPGATILKEALLTMTEVVFGTQLRAAEKSALEKQDATTGPEGEGNSLKAQTDLGSQSFALSTPDDWTVGLFLKQTMRMLASNTFMIHDWMMTILYNTNAMVSYHVTLCLRYLSQLVTDFPAYFADDHSASSTVLLQTFTQLLQSEHFEVLRNTELFLMKHFTGFSITLREALVTVFAAEFKRLFLHWNRDVRFCYYHMLLYLTYPGNRLVLGATSDELLMGAEAAYLFEIPGLVRNTTSAMAAQWTAFDGPLCDLIAYVNRTAKHTPSTSLKTASASVRGSSTGAMLKPRTRPQQNAPTTRASMTLRPRPSSSRSSLSTRPGQYGRASLSAMPASTGRVSVSASIGPATMVAAPPKSAPSAMQTPPPPAWIQALPLSSMQRSVQEYRRHVETYFSFARQISIHEPVPTPMLQTAKA